MAPCNANAASVRWRHRPASWRTLEQFNESTASVDRLSIRQMTQFMADRNPVELASWLRVNLIDDTCYHAHFHVLRDASEKW
jgi:hypothetical protein